MYKRQGYDPWHIDDSLLRQFKDEFGERAMIPVRQGAPTLAQPMTCLLYTSYRKQGLEFKWVAVTEYENKAIHHHLVVNGIDSRILTRLWSYGRMHIASLDDTGDYIQLAEYLVKETSKTFRNPNATQKKRWRCSRNLKRPESKKERCV